MDKQKQIDLMAEMYNDIMYFALVVLRMIEVEEVKPEKQKD